MIFSTDFGSCDVVFLPKTPVDDKNNTNVINRRCFASYHDTNLVYFIRPTRNIKYLTHEDALYYLNLVDKSGVISSPMKIVSSKDELEAIYKSWNTKDDLEQTWKEIETKSIIPILTEAKDFGHRRYQGLAYRSMLRNIDDNDGLSAAIGAVELSKKYGDQFTPFEYIVYGHYYGPWIKEPHTGHSLLTQAFIKAPKAVTPNLFSFGVQSGLDKLVVPFKLVLPAWGGGGYYYTTQTLPKLLQDIPLPEFVARLDKIQAERTTKPSGYV